MFDSIKKRMQERVPGVADIAVTVTEDGRLLMRYRDGAFQDPFIDKNVSDGTIKMFAYLVLLADPKPHPILCVEEPEMGDALRELARSPTRPTTRMTMTQKRTLLPKLDDRHWERAISRTSPMRK